MHLQNWHCNVNRTVSCTELRTWTVKLYGLRDFMWNSRKKRERTETTIMTICASNKRQVELKAKRIHARVSSTFYTYGLFYSGTYYLDIFTAINVFAKCPCAWIYCTYWDAPNIFFNPTTVIYDLINRHRFF